MLTGSWLSIIVAVLSTVLFPDAKYCSHYQFITVDLTVNAVIPAPRLRAPPLAPSPSPDFSASYPRRGPTPQPPQRAGELLIRNGRAGRGSHCSFSYRRS